MPIFNDTLLTDKGYIAANKAANGQGSFTLTRAVASPRDYKELSSAAMRQLTSLDNESAGKLAAQDNVDARKTKITTKFSNELEPKGYTANTVGLYAKDDNGQEFLYSVTPSTIGQVIPEQNNNLFEGFELDIYVIVGNVQNMHVELTPGGDVSVEYVNKVVSQAKDDINAILKLKMNRNADGTVPDSANFVSGIQKDGVDVPNMDDLKKALESADFGKVKGDYAPGRSFDEMIGKNSFWDINNHNFNDYGANQGLPDLRGVYGYFFTLASNGFTTMFIFTADGRLFYAPKSPYLAGNWVEVASRDYVNELTTRQFDNANSVMKNYVDSNQVLSIPNTSIEKGDNYDNYRSKYVHKDIDGLNISKDISSSEGLPDKVIWGDFISIPNHNTTVQIINDNVGNCWRRVTGRRWAQIITGTFPIGSNIPDELNGYNVTVIPNGGNLANYTTPSDTIYYSTAGSQITGSPYGTRPFILQVVSDPNEYFQNIINVDNGSKGTPYSRGRVNFDWRTANYYDTKNEKSNWAKFKNQLFKQYGGGI